jgi:hypothetical protein
MAAQSKNRRMGVRWSAHGMSGRVKKSITIKRDDLQSAMIFQTE